MSTELFPACFQAQNAPSCWKSRSKMPRIEWQHIPFRKMLAKMTTHSLRCLLPGPSRMSARLLKGQVHPKCSPLDSSKHIHPRQVHREGTSRLKETSQLAKNCLKKNKEKPRKKKSALKEKQKQKIKK